LRATDGFGNRTRLAHRCHFGSVRFALCNANLNIPAQDRLAAP